MSPATQYFLAALLTVLVGVVDVLTGPDVSVSIFYLLPIAVLAWYRGWTSTWVVVLASIIVWMAADALSGHAYTNPLIRYWNAAVRLGFFALSAFLMKELRAALDRARLLAHTDALTGVPNSRSFFDIAAREVARQQRYLHPLSIAFLDCDNFKQVNDTLGHASGDGLLCTIASCIQDSLRGVDTVARMGGDEFAVLLPESDAQAAATVCAKIRDVLTPATADYGVTISIGIVTYYEPPLNAEELVRSADEAMYDAKRHGKNASRQRIVGSDLRKAIQ